MFGSSTLTRFWMLFCIFGILCGRVGWCCALLLWLRCRFRSMRLRLWGLYGCFLFGMSFLWNGFVSRSRW